jgi:hypothetical protein
MSSAMIRPLAGCLLLGGLGCASASNQVDPSPPEPGATSAAAPSASAEAPIAPSGPLASMAWLTGRWTGTSGENVALEETWSAPGGGAMTGVGVMRPSGKAERREELRIEARDDGAIVYVATPEGQARTEFRSEPRLAGPTAATFVNEDHDWPTRIRYERVGDELRVTLKGRPGQAAESWTLRRQP